MASRADLVLLVWLSSGGHVMYSMQINDELGQLTFAAQFCKHVLGCLYCRFQKCLIQKYVLNFVLQYFDLLAPLSSILDLPYIDLVCNFRSIDSVTLAEVF